jgi:signal transduction histidine kinase
MPERDATGLKAKPAAPVSSWKFFSAVTWLLLTVALASWWMIFGLRQIQLLGESAGGAAWSLEIARQHRMLLSEGSTLIVLLLAGGAALLYFIFSEIRRARRIQEFFAAFTHDMKTSLASLRLQGESLEEDLRSTPQAKVARRLVKDTVRLELQLENSLLLASPGDSRLLIEERYVSDVIDTLTDHWPELEITKRGDGTVWGDTRALESIFKNLFQNAVVHGRATKVEVTIEAGEPGRLRIKVEDNGRGFSGDREKLGKMFHRHSSTSGSGLGLYIATSLAQRMDGDLKLLESRAGSFCVEISLPGRESGSEPKVEAAH